MIKFLRNFIQRMVDKLFQQKRHIKMGLYGPPNSGKCVTPETGIVFADGSIHPIGEIFASVQQQSHLVKQAPAFTEAYIDVRDKNLQVLSLDPTTLRIAPKQVSLVYAQQYRGTVYNIRTRSGRTITTTPEHPLVCLSNEGVQKVRSVDLQVGQKIAATLLLHCSREITLSTYSLLQEKVIVGNQAVVWDDIISIEQIPYDGYVYDLTIEDTHTFVISNGLIASNTTLANRICKDWLGEKMGTVSNIPHETREIQIKEKIHIKHKNKELTFSLVDTPGIATKIDYEDFMKYKMSEKEAKNRAKEATKGVIESIKWLDDMDCVVVVLDSTLNPYSQVNVTIIGNLAARDIPVLIAGNKTDLKKSSIKKIESAFPQYDVVGISAMHGKNMEEFYESLFRVLK